MEGDAWRIWREDSVAFVHSLLSPNLLLLTRRLGTVAEDASCILGNSSVIARRKLVFGNESSHCYCVDADAIRSSRACSLAMPHNGYRYQVRERLP